MKNTMQEKKTDYNGWTNYATWNFGIWMDNEEPIYRRKMELIDTIDDLTASDVKTFARLIFPTGNTPDTEGNDWEGGRWEDINWDEIAENWNQEREEA